MSNEEKVDLLLRLPRHLRAAFSSKVRMEDSNMREKAKELIEGYVSGKLNTKT